MTIHIGAEKGDIAETVLMPGDPYRARWAAENFLSDARMVNEVRGMLGFTGAYKGNAVTIQASGMGQPSLSIYVNELIKDYGAKTLIRIGSTGALADHIKLRDIVIAMTASTGVNINGSWLGSVNFAPCANYELLRRAAHMAEARSIPAHIGGIFTGDLFYEGDMARYDALRAHGVLAVEMETAELYTLAARYDCRALSLLTVSDHLYQEAELSSHEREQSFGDMIEMALAAAFD